jgi:hypothetical protein
MVALLVVAVALGLNNFGAAIAIGVGGVDRRTEIKVATVFGLCDVVMPASGMGPGADVYPRRVSTGIAGQKWRNAPPMTHAHAEPPIRAPFRTLSGEMSPASLAPAGPWPLPTRNLDPRPPQFNPC